MKTSQLLCLSLLLVAFASLTEAGCDQNGCCYCNGQSGRVIYTGIYKPDCNPGYQCRCGYDDRRFHYFGQCNDGSSGPCGSSVPNIARPVPQQVREPAVPVPVPAPVPAQANNF